MARKGITESNNTARRVIGCMGVIIWCIVVIVTKSLLIRSRPLLMGGRNEFFVRAGSNTFVI
jgi:hypothetical protein